MPVITVDKYVGEIKPLHGVGQPPFSGLNFSKFAYLTEAGIPFSRLHDAGGAYVEPDNEEDPLANPMWRGSKEQFFALYETAAKHLKACFPHLKIGGYGSCDFYSVANAQTDPNAKASPRADYFVEFFEQFLQYAQTHGCPLDFFSWHSYASVADTAVFARYARQKLDEYGFFDAETTCNEWNCEADKRGTARS